MANFFHSLVYAVEQLTERGSDYSHLNLVVYECQPMYERAGSQRSLATFTWQTDATSTYWYAMRITGLPSEIDGLATWDKVRKLLDAFARQVTKEYNGLQYYSSLTPTGVAHILERLGILRGLYDLRIGYVEALDKLPAPELKRWDALHTNGRNWNYQLAETEREAQQQLTLRAERDTYLQDASSYVGWLREGRPMRESVYCAPVNRSFEELCHCSRWNKHEPPYKMEKSSEHEARFAIMTASMGMPKSEPPEVPFRIWPAQKAPGPEDIDRVDDKLRKS